MKPEDIIAILSASLALVGAFCFCGLIIQLVVAWYLSTCIERIPKQFRQLEPWAPYLFFLGMAPCIGFVFSLIYNFIFWDKLSASFKAYFDSVGDSSVGDCGKQLGQANAILVVVISMLAVVAQIPLIGILLLLFDCFLGLVSFVISIILLIKAGQYKNMIPPEQTTAVSGPV